MKTIDQMIKDSLSTGTTITLPGGTLFNVARRRVPFLPIRRAYTEFLLPVTPVRSMPTIAEPSRLSSSVPAFDSKPIVGAIEASGRTQAEAIRSLSFQGIGSVDQGKIAQAVVEAMSRHQLNLRLTQKEDSPKPIIPASYQIVFERDPESGFIESATVKPIN